MNIFYHAGGSLVIICAIALCCWALPATVSEAHHYYQSNNLAVAWIWGFISALTGIYIFIFTKLLWVTGQGLLQLVRGRRGPAERVRLGHLSSGIYGIEATAAWRKHTIRPTTILTRGKTS